MNRGMSRAARLQRIEELLLSMPGGYTIQELAEKLEVHRTTIWRDLSDISCEVPVQQDDNRYFIDRTDYLSSVRLSLTESLMLYILMRRAMRRPFMPPTMIAALEKLTFALSHPSSGQLAETLEVMLHDLQGNPEQVRTWEVLAQAWQEQITVRITYQELSNPDSTVCEVQPYLFEPAIMGDGIYLIGYSVTQDALKTFKVDRIVKAELTARRFVRPDDIGVDTILRQVWGIWYNEEVTEVRLRFRPTVASQIRDTLWIPSQKTIDLPDGGVEWSAKVTNVPGLLPWIRSWGPDCEVLEPQMLREYLAELEQFSGGVMMTATDIPNSSEAFYAAVQEVMNGDRIRVCLQCSTCSGICPFGYLMDYPPQRLIAAVRAGMFDTVLDSDTAWMCVSCYACTQVCPQQIPLTIGLMTRAKEELLLAGNVPRELRDALKNSQRYGNPLGESPRKRAAWTMDIEPEVTIMGEAGRPVDVLWFVGDYASYHPRVQLVSKALAKILNALGVDFGILGPEENSDGDSQRLAGERGLFEMLAEKNGQAFDKYEFNEIITTDPHAYNAIKNEYPSLGISYPVRHYTQFLAERLDQLRPLLTQEIDATITFHDPCYLGRVNGEYEAPRELIKAIPGVELIEMSHTRQNSLCCGGGGGGMWLDGFQWEKAHTRMSEWRVREAVAASGADRREPFHSVPLTEKERERARKRKKPIGVRDFQILAVACPYEAPRFEDAIKMIEGAERLMVKDIAELLAEAMGE